MIKLLSFDLDGTLLDNSNYDDIFWYEEVPKLYAQKHHLTFQRAKSIVQREYDKLGPLNVNWYRPSYWFKLFHLQQNPKQILHDMRHRIHLFPEVRQVLNQLHKKYKMIVITNSSKEFVEIKMKTESILTYFDKIFSSIDDFNTQKDPRVFKEILKLYKINPAQTIHIGDDYRFDYTIPKRLGINAFYLDRKREKNKSQFIVHNLKQFADKIKELDKK